MKGIVLVATLAAPFVLAACASDGGASYGAIGQTEPGYITVKDGKRQEALVGTRLARETRENAESVKSISRKGYKDSQMEKSGAPLEGQKTGM